MSETSGMAAQACVPSTWKANVGGLVTFSSLGYKLSSRLVSKKKRKKKARQQTNENLYNKAMTMFRVEVGSGVHEIRRANYPIPWISIFSDSKDEICFS